MDTVGVFDSMKNTGVLQDAKNKDIEWIFVTPVDNPLMELIDPIFIGIAKLEGYEMIGKSIVRTDPTQKNGVFCKINGKVNVMEYTEIPKELMEKQNEDGNLYLRFAHINCNMFSIDTIDKILKIDIPYHIANKKSKYLNINGNLVEPTEPNCFKYEKFIFDYFPHIEKVGIFAVNRNLEYEPIKANADKAREAYINKWGLK